MWTANALFPVFHYLLLQRYSPYRRQSAQSEIIFPCILLNIHIIRSVQIKENLNNSNQYTSCTHFSILDRYG